MARKHVEVVDTIQVPVGVYKNCHSETAIVVQSKPSNVWYLTLCEAKVEIHTAGHDRFLRDYAIALVDYPLRRAVRLYNESTFTRDERTQKVMERLLGNL